MTPREVTAIAIVAIIFGSMMVSAIMRAVLRRPAAVDSKQLEEISARLAHLEQSVDAIAVRPSASAKGSASRRNS